MTDSGRSGEANAAAFDEIALWYDEAIRVGPQALFHDLVVPALLDLAGDLGGRRVCDLACGQGIVARRLAKLGADVVGVDVSEKLLDIARDRERWEPLGISYLRDDARSLGSIADAVFDGVACNLALVDIPDLDACLRSVARVLRPQGWFVFSITHPCFLTPASRWVKEETSGTVRREVGGYFTEGFWHSDYAEGIRGKVGSHHRTLSAYFGALVQAGLAVERLAEPRPARRIVERFPGYKEVPPFLVARCIR